MNATRDTEWHTIRLADFGEVITGKTPPSSQPELFGSLYPFITPSDMEFGIRRITTERFISEDGAKHLRRIKLPVNTPTMVCIGATIGKTCLTTGICFTNQQLNSIVVDTNKHDARFVFYVLVCISDRIKQIAGGAATPIVNKSSFSNIEVFVPINKSLQRRIASILSAYDDLIENNTRRIAILEEMARRLYEEWFVIFRFPGHEKARFVETELGLVPEGWEQGTLKDIIVLQRGYDLPNKLRNSGPYPVIASTGYSTTHSEAKVKSPCVVTGRSGSIGKVMYISKDFWPLNTTLWGKSYPLKSVVFAYFSLQSIDFNAFNSGAAVPSLNRNNIHELPFTLPSKTVIEEFEKNIAPLFVLKENLQQKNANLRAQRDLLLPKLISGELDVSEAEDIVKGAAV